MKTNLFSYIKNTVKSDPLMLFTDSVRIAALLLAFAIILTDKMGCIFRAAERTDISEQVPTDDELMSGFDELIPENDDIIIEKDHPLGIGIYDKLFISESKPTPNGELKIVNTDLSQNPLPEGVLIKNNTTYAFKISDYLTMKDKKLDENKKYDPSEPIVLIYHTHGTEGYAEEGKSSYPPSSLPRSRDITKNVVAVGKALCEILNENGIPALHDTVMHDDGSYNTAYNNSAKSIKEYLKKYPSIKYCFDIHRDALVSSTSVYKTVTYDESTPLAQIMFVVGTDSAGANHKTWKRCMSFAVNAQYYLASRLNNLIRPISIKQSSYNQQYPYVGALIEVGTCANTLKEALNSTKILGDVISSMILSELDLYQ